MHIYRSGYALGQAHKRGCYPESYLQPVVRVLTTAMYKCQASFPALPLCHILRASTKPTSHESRLNLSVLPFSSSFLPGCSTWIALVAREPINCTDTSAFVPAPLKRKVIYAVDSFLTIILLCCLKARMIKDRKTGSSLSV